jgi:GT2 family glycosyltransferase
LECQLGFLEKRPDLAGTGSAVGFIGADGTPVASEKYAMRRTDPAELRLRQREGWNCFVHSSMLVRRSIVTTIVGYRTIFRHAEDDDFFLRLLDHGDLANMPRALVLFRQHAGNSSTPTPAVVTHRVAALASAHLRLAGGPDPLDARTAPIDRAFLEELLDALGDAATPVLLAWIGLLQHHRLGEHDALPQAWRRLTALPSHEEWAKETARHAANCRERFPLLWNEITV